MASEFAIGSTLLGIETLDAIGLPNPFPVEYEPVGETYESLSGMPAGDGPGRAAWSFDILTLDQMDTLLGYLTGQGGAVFITTRIEDGSTYAGQFKTFSAFMWRPTKDEYTFALGRRYFQDVTIRFTTLVEQA